MAVLLIPGGVAGERGADTDQILKELGRSPAAIADLRADGIVK